MSFYNQFAASVVAISAGLALAGTAEVRKDFPRSVDRAGQIVKSSGVSLKQLNQRLNVIEKENFGKPFVITRAKWLMEIMNTTRLAVAGDDVFVDWFEGWLLLQQRQWNRVDAFKARRPELQRPYRGAYLDTSHTCPDWESILALGPKGLAERARRSLETKDKVEERTYLSCVVEVYEAMSRLCIRWASAAEQVGARECAGTLREIAQHPPRTLREALQLMLVYDRCQETEIENVRSQGLFDRLYIRFYRDDIAAGRETPESAKRLIKAVFDKIHDQAHPNGKNFAFGGYDRSGRPVWNEITEIAFDLQYELNRINPKFTYRYGAKTPREHLEKVARNLAAGRTAVVFFNEEASKEMFVRRGKDPADVADAVLIGCYEPAIQGREVIASMMVQINLVKPMEAVINGGRTFDGKVIGPECALPADYAAFEREYLRQVKTLIEGGLEDGRKYAENWAELNPSPLMSGAFRDAVAKGKDAYSGAMKYNQSGVMMAGMPTVVDSLAAVRYLVDETRQLTMAELSETLKNDWKGREELRLKVKRLAPKWGNNDDRADEIAKRVAKFVTDIVNATPNGHGGTFQAGLWSIDNDVKYGKWTGATADGRHNGERLGRNNSATAGCGREGVTALLLSNAKIDQANAPDGYIVDAMLPATALSEDDRKRQIVSVLEVFRERGGLCIHLNCLDVGMLRDAQAHPEKYPELQVRVCGWNVRWNDLTRADQDYFIATAASQE